MRHLEETFTGQAKKTIHLSSWLPDSPSGHTNQSAGEGAPKGVVVIAHGFGEHSGRYGNIAGPLLDSGYALYIPDHRGHGRSEGHRALIDKHDYLLDDLDQVFAIAAQRHPAVPTYLVGHSMGGNIALASALRRQSHLSGLVLSGPLVTNHGISPVLIKVAPLLGRIAPKLGTVKLSAAAVSRDPAVVAAYEADPLVFHGKMPAGTGGALIRSSAQFHARLPQLLIPLLVVHGSADQLVSPESGRAAYRLAGSADKTLKIYDGLFHEVMNEPEHRTVVGDIVAWLNDHKPVGPRQA